MLDLQYMAFLAYLLINDFFLNLNKKTIVMVIGEGGSTGYGQTIFSCFLIFGTFMLFNLWKLIIVLY